MSPPPAPYPLTWPDNLPRTARRSGSQFRTNLNKAMANVQNSLRLFGSDSSKAVSNVVISSNVALGVSRPDDPGVAIWFTWDGLSVCVAVDRYGKVEDNVQAIHLIIEARRTELRHGGLNIVRASLAGFAALPSPSPRPHWTAVLDLPANATRDAIEATYRKRAKAAHPDAGGSDEQMAMLNTAKSQALREAS